MELTASEKITKAKIQLYDEAPFLSYIINHLQFRSDNKLTKTMGVDARGNCRYSEKFVNKLDFEELKCVLAHEALHCAFEHLKRLNKKDIKIWNIATDIIINNLLINQGMQVPKVGSIPQHNTFSIKEFNLTINNIDKKFAEVIYNELRQVIPEKKIKKLIIKVGSFDEHKYNSNKQNDNNGGGNRGVEVEVGETDWKKVLAEANTFAKQKGKGSKELDRIVEASLTKRINWKHLLSKYMTSDIASNYSYARPSKRSFAAGAYLPYLSKENMNITIAIDTSGSIGQKELSEFMGQIYAITKSFINIKLTLLFHDDKIVKEEHFNNMNLRQILKIKPMGGGGTSHEEVMDYTKKNNVNILVCFTDGYSDINQTKIKYNKTIFVLTTKSCDEPKYGRCVYYEQEDL